MKELTEGERKAKKELLQVLAIMPSAVIEVNKVTHLFHDYETDNGGKDAD